MDTAPRRRTFVSAPDDRSPMSAMARSGSVNPASSAAQMPAVTDTGVATVVATAVDAVIEDGTPCPNALLLATLHRSRAAVALEPDALRCFLQTARLVSPSMLLRTLVLSMPKVVVSTPPDLANDESRAIVSLAADAVVRAALDEAKRVLPASVDKEGLVSGALATLPAATDLADMRQDFETTVCKVVDTVATPETTAAATGSGSAGRNLSLTAVYQAARSRLSLLAASLRKGGGNSGSTAALRRWDVVVDVRDEAEAAMLRSEGEDPLTGRSALRRTLEDLAWLCRPLPPTVPLVAGVEPAPARLVLVDRTASSVVVDIVRRFANSAALPGYVSLVCIVVHPSSAALPRTTLGAFLRNDFTCPEGCLIADDADDPTDMEAAGAIAFVPCGLAMETLQLGLFCDALFNRAAAAGATSAAPPPTIAAVSDLANSVAPLRSFESARSRCFRAVAASLLADATGVTDDLVPRVACGVFAPALAFAAGRVRTALAAAIDASPAVAAHGVLGAPLLALLLDVIHRMSEASAPASVTPQPLSLEPTAPTASLGGGAQCVSAVATVSLHPPCVAASAEDISDAIAAACGVFSRQGFEPAFDAATEPPAAPASSAAGPSPGNTTLGASSVTNLSPEGLAAQHSPEADEGDGTSTAPGTAGTSALDAAASAEKLRWRRRQWAAVGALLQEEGARLWAAALRDHQQLVDVLAAPIPGSAPSAVEWLRTNADDAPAAVAASSHGVYVRPCNFLALPRWQDPMQHLISAAAEAAAAAAAAANPSPSATSGKARRG